MLLRKTECPDLNIHNLVLIRDIFDKMEEDMFGKKVESGGADDELNGSNVIPFKK